MSGILCFMLIVFLAVLVFLIFISVTPGRAVLVIGILAGIFTAFVAAVYAKAETLEERICIYEEQHFEQEPSRFIFIGDSRVAGMQMSVPYDEKDIWSCKESIGYDWMVSDGLPAVEDSITEDTAVFILLGINDLGNCGKYSEYLNMKAAEWKGNTYFVSVGPVTNTTVTNTQIESFNSAIKDGADSYKYIDLYSSMLADGFGTVDGLHYTSGTYQYIYDFLKSACI